MTHAQATALQPGTADFLNALAELVALHGDAEIATLEERPDFLKFLVEATPFAWIDAALGKLDAKPDGETVGDVITAMGITSFVCPGHGNLIDGDRARRGFAYSLGGERNGAVMSASEVADSIREIIKVLPPPPN